MRFENGKALFGGVDYKKLVDEFETPLYVYEQNRIEERFREMNEAVTYKPRKLLYACKANTNLHLMHILKDAGCDGIDAASPGEVELAKKAGFVSSQIYFTSNSASRAELEYVAKEGTNFNADSFEQVRTYGAIAKRKGKISVRINPNIGAGHHRHVITGGENSKFGIPQSKAEEIYGVAENAGLKINGVHMHVGSRFLTSQSFLKAAKSLLEAAKYFPDLEYVNFGGGVGIPYAPREKEIDLKYFGSRLSKTFEDWCKDYGRELELVLENGRYFVADSGYLLTTVTDVKHTPKHVFVGTDTGFNHLIRPMLYGSYHKIVNLSNPNGKKRKVVVTGNICESGDVFTQSSDGIEDRKLAEPRVGDVLAILNAGAYGFAMSSNYNSRPRPAEVLVDNGEPRLIRRRETYHDLMRTIM